MKGKKVGFLVAGFVLMVALMAPVSTLAQHREGSGHDHNISQDRRGRRHDRVHDRLGDRHNRFHDRFGDRNGRRHRRFHRELRRDHRDAHDRRFGNNRRGLVRRL